MTTAIDPHPRTGFVHEYPFESRFVEIDGHRYHYVDEGPRDAEPLLMVHGNPTWSFAWRNVVKACSADYRCIAIDHIGCGMSDKPARYRYVLDQHVSNLSEFVDRLDLQRVTLIGHDWGGCIGVGTVVRRTSRFARMVLSNTAAFRSSHMPWRIAVCRWPVVGPLGVRGFNLFARMALSMAVENPGALSRAARRGLLAPYDSWAHRVAIQRFVEDIPTHAGHPSHATLVEIEEGLERLRELPTLLVWGERDWCFTPAFREEFEQRLPRAKSVPLPNAGHYVFEDALEEYVGAVREFLSEN